MSNTIQIKRGTTIPKQGDLAPYELGYVVPQLSTGKENTNENAGFLFIGGSPNVEGIKVSYARQLLSGTVGSPNVPTYFNNGAPEQCSAISLPAKISFLDENFKEPDAGTISFFEGYNNKDQATTGYNLPYGADASNPSRNDVPAAHSRWYITRFRHSNADALYYTDLAIPLTGGSLYFKQIADGKLARGWVRILDTNNYNEYTYNNAINAVNATNATNATYSYLLKPHSNNITTSNSTWQGGGVDDPKQVLVWGQKWVANNISTDTGDMVLKLRPSQYTNDSTELCISIDGDYYAALGNKVLHAGNYRDYALPLSGGKINGSLSIGDKVTFKTDTEGGNITLIAPGGQYWEIDAYNEHLRIYSNADGMPAYTFSNDATVPGISLSRKSNNAIETFEFLHTGNSYVLLKENGDISNQNQITNISISGYNFLLFTAKTKNEQDFVSTLVPISQISPNFKCGLGNQVHYKYFTINITNNILTITGGDYENNGIEGNSFFIYGLK